MVKGGDRMADNPFVVVGDEWGFCTKHKTRCTSAWDDGTCMRPRCNQFNDEEEEKDNEGNV